MIKTNPHIDVTKPEVYNELIRKGAILTQEIIAEWYTIYGKIKDTVYGFDVVLKPDQNFYLEDGYCNTLYIAKYNKKEDVFALIDSSEFQFCKTLREFDVLIRKTFKRKPSLLE